MTIPVVDLIAEASEACVQAVPGAVFLRLRHMQDNTVLRRMFVEMTPNEARLLVDDLQVCIEQAEQLTA